MIIDPHGLIYGERIAACSDEAQLHFPRFLAASNSFGRIQMSVQRIISEVYGAFKTPPSKEQVAGWLKEYHERFLLFVYRGHDGALWGQWDVPRKMLGTYRLKRDHDDPEPPAEEWKAFLDRYAAIRAETNSVNSDDISEMFSEIPQSSKKVSGKTEKFTHGVVVVVGVDAGVGDGVGITPQPPKGGLRKSEQRKLNAATVGMYKGPTELSADAREEAGRQEVLAYWRDLRTRDPAAYPRKADAWVKKILDEETT